MKKILFLDIDGVLKSLDNQQVQSYLWHQNKENKSKDEFGQLFDERCCRWLEYIYNETNCKIVISSTWKDSGLEQMKLLFKTRNIKVEILDITPSTINQSLLKTFYKTNIDEAQRGFEIQQWLDINDYDNSDMLPHQLPYFVQTNDQIGLNKECSTKIIKILNKIPMKCTANKGDYPCTIFGSSSCYQCALYK